ncbi:MAG: Crp/Fnr family transcriptional regulator [Cyclobacteriaceae bacterium]|nr:Crp/Fnr family transcriptional regulator [Cyclobacteriaceae bacterium]
MPLKNRVDVRCSNCKTKGKSLLCMLTEDQLEGLDQGKTCIIYKKGQTLFYEGTRPMGLYCIKSGKVKIFKMGSQGKEQILRLANPGDFLGYRSLLGEELYAASGEVLEDAAICFIPKESFYKSLIDNKEFYKTMVKSLAHELGVVEEKLSDLSQKSVRERLAGNLLMLKETYGLEGEEDSTLIDLSISREDLANIVGTATETVIRLLSEFKKDGLISLEGKKIRVIDPRGLAREADFYGG